MVSSIFSIFFRKTKFSIQVSLRQFFFEFNRISIHGDILKKQFAGHHGGTHNSEKWCFRLRQKIYWPISWISHSVKHQKNCFTKSERRLRSPECAGDDFPVYSRQVRRWIFYHKPIKKFFHSNKHTQSILHKFFTGSISSSVISSVFISVIFGVKFMLILY